MRVLLCFVAFATMALIGCEAQNDSPSDPSNNGTAGNNEGSNNNSTNNATNNRTTGGENNGTSNAACGAARSVVDFTTSDDVKLVADYQPASAADRGAVVLLHMIPPSWDRTSYPPRILDAIHELDLNVLNVDRRGAGESAGTATDAYEGDTARLDVEASVAFLTRQGCAVDLTKLVLVGASNGTTAVMDYTVNRSDTTLPDPVSLIWLSPGTYTENQNRIADHSETLEALPILFIHPDSEPWSRQHAGTSDRWEIVEIAGGQHGTRNFDSGTAETTQWNAMEGWLENLR